MALGTFSLASFQRIVVFGLAGNDSISIEARIDKPATLYGDAGNDSLSGGSGPDILDDDIGFLAPTEQLGEDQQVQLEVNPLSQSPSPSHSVYRLRLKPFPGLRQFVPQLRNAFRTDAELLRGRALCPISLIIRSPGSARGALRR